ncbi:MAG TPA: lysoplasmalogenase [Ohtaekwangia sp.]
MKKLALIVFVLVSLGDLLAILADWSFLHHLCKPLITVALFVFYIRAAGTNRSMGVLLALIFSFAGDTLLLYEDKNGLYFIFGLIAFLLAHVFYILVYRQHRAEAGADQLQGVQRARLAFPIILAGSGLVIILYPTLGDLQVPVMVYAAVLVIMVLNALFRMGRTNQSSFWLVFAGALLFMVSDSLLAINKFFHPITYAGVFIMTTYISAQFLIVKGLIKHFTK